MTENPRMAARNEIVTAALACAAQTPWEDVKMSDIARQADIGLAVLHDFFEDKADILSALGRMIDRQVLEALDATAENQTPRDRLFEIMMERFDVLSEHRAGIVSILRSFRLDPKQAIISVPDLCRSMSWMLEAAGLDTGGLQGAARVAGLTALYLRVLRIWSEDDSADMAKTMAALDKDLARIEGWAGRLGL
jgi:AcrR family transcriptional regulator